MRRTLTLGLAAAVVLSLAVPGRSAAPVPNKLPKPKVEVVFCLDTTGSMTGLIDGAKAKIWAICNQIASGKPIPDLKVGLVAYRDRGDDYVTRVFDLSDDLDAILRAVLRAGAYELRHRNDVPARVVVSEYVDVANAFVDHDETGMVNAVLDAIARQSRTGEFAPARG